MTGKIYLGDSNLLWQAGGSINHWRIMGFPRGFREVDRGQYDAAETTTWASGAMTLFRAGPLAEIGLLPEEYFFGQEEWDYSTNLIRRGYRIGYEPRFVGHHYHGASYTTNPALNSYGAIRNRHLYAEKYLNRPGFHLWRSALRLHLDLFMYPKLRLRRAHLDVETHVKAMRLGWKRHKRGQPVTLDELQDVLRELAVSPDWHPRPDA